jgi:SAM-dependent methyltransferase
MQTTVMNSGSSKYGGEELQRIYTERFFGRLEYRNKVWRVLTRDYFQKYVRPEDAVLDLGAGYGEFINNIRCAKKYAMDLNPDTKEKVDADVEVFSQDCSSLWPLPDNSLDVVFTSNFFEHLPDAETLARTLSEARRCLKQGGKLIALGPNISYCGAAYWSVVDHHVALSEKSLSDAFVEAGLGIDTCIDKFMPFTMSEGPQYPTFFVSLYLYVPLVWRILGKQFLVIGVKG